MKKLILLELCLLFLATTFRGDSPPSGWYIQQIPVNKNITDIYFTDTLNGWAVTKWATSTDTGYVLKTTNGGTNWYINYQTHIYFDAVQFIDNNTGYISGYDGIGVVCKTTNSGLNWNIILHAGFEFTDLYFLNKDTGWVCDDDNLAGIGLIKTTNGGLNWFQQMSNSYQPKKIFFLNRDTGWVMTADRKLYRTMNSGGNWELLFSFNTSYNFKDIFFTSKDTGWISLLGSNLDDLQRTTNGGYNWQVHPYPYSTTDHTGKIYMINSLYGYIGFSSGKILKTTDGYNWNHQNAYAGAYNIIYFTDSLHGWASHSYNNFDIAATIDGGGPVLGVRQISGEAPDGYKLEQNYPNPFNSITNFKFQILNSGNIKIILYDISGKEIRTIVNERRQAGVYEVKFDAGNLSSGVYFYLMKGATTDNREIFLDTKKMLLIK